MKMAIRLDLFEQGVDQEITILDLKPRMTAEAFEHAALQPQNESLWDTFWTRSMPDTVNPGG